MNGSLFLDVSYLNKNLNYYYHIISSEGLKINTAKRISFEYILNNVFSGLGMKSMINK